MDARIGRKVPGFRLAAGALAGEARTAEGSDVEGTVETSSASGGIEVGLG
jgi:hypothetical protein